MQTNRELLQQVYETLYSSNVSLANLDQLASDLSKLAHRARPWTGKYLYNLLKGYPGFSFSPELIESLSILASRLDGVDEVQARAKEAPGVFSVSELPAGTVILGQARKCANPACQVVFVPTHPKQRYHSRGCWAEVYNRRKRGREG